MRLLVTAALLLSCGAASAYRPGQGAGPVLPAGVTRLLFKELCKGGCSGREVSRWKRGLKFEAHDLNADGAPEFFVYVEHGDWCGAGANCSYWVFQKRGRGYALLLNDKVLRVRGGVSHGYRDLASETPMGFCGRNVQRLDVTPYRFDGARYRAQPRETECRAFTPPAAR
jgi:hypothetical protein